MTPATWPRPLRAGDSVAIIAPSGPVDPANLGRGMAALEARGLRFKLGAHLRERHHYLAGDDAARWADWQAAWEDPEVHAVWCARGGYGAMRLLPRIDFDVVRQRNLPFIGYSDITALQGAIAARGGPVTFSGAMAASGYGYGAAQGIDPETERLLWRWLDPEPGWQPLAQPDDRPLTVLQAGRARGPLRGGCLTLVAATLGTPYAPDLADSILVLEDVDEDPYRLDRYLAQLYLAGVFEQVGAVVLGDFASCYPPVRSSDGPRVEELVLGYLEGRAVPVLCGLAYGHIRRRCALPLGAWARVEADSTEARIEVEGPAPA